MANSIYAEAIKMVESRLWSQERAALELSSTREPHPADWPPEERPGFDDIEAARLLGVDPRPPRIDITEQVAYWDDPIMRADQVQAVAALTQQMEALKRAMARNNAPQPKTFMIHPQTWDELKASLEEF